MSSQPQIVYVPVPTPPPPSLASRFFSWSMRAFFLFSILLNILLFGLLVYDADPDAITERTVQGRASASRKIAIVRVEGVIVDGMIDHPLRQLKAAAQDEEVEAVVVVVNSPGGSVTASDMLHKGLKDLRDGEWAGQKRGKPVIVSMQSIAASGGYYLAAPAQRILAQPTTITGSIGVYAQLLNIHKLAEENGIQATLLKKGELKGSGSLFKPLEPDERLEFDDLLEASYQRFMEVVRDGRGERLKHGLRDEITVTSRTDPKRQYVRRLADGGAFTADEALTYGLIDGIGFLDEALAEAKKMVGGDPETIRVISYPPPFNLWSELLGIRKTSAPIVLDRVPGATARQWYLAPGYELAGIPLR